MLRTILHCGFAIEPSAPAKQLFVGQAFRQAVETALDKAGSREQRRRRLPAAAIMTLIVALSLFRNLSIPAVYRQIHFWARRGRKGGTCPVTDEALVHAKTRLGATAPSLLFQALANEAAVLPSFFSLRVFGVDGVRLSMPDTTANDARFGRYTASKGDRTAFPQLLALALIAVETRHVRRIRIEPCTASERDLCVPFLDDLDHSDLVLMDRGFHAVWLFKKFLERSVHFLCRASASYKPRILKRLGHGDYLVLASARVRAPDNTWKREALTLRMIEYRVGRRRRVRVLTDLTDPQQYPALRLAALYRERWECELAYDEIKTHLAAPPRGVVQLPFRSKTPDAVLQEAYGLFTAYNLVRSWMAAAAAAAGVPTRQISFVGALHVIHLVFSSLGSFAFVPAAIIDAIGLLKLSRPRRPRRYHRVVRVKIARFPRKRKWHQLVRVDYTAQVRLVNHYSPRSAAA